MVTSPNSRYDFPPDFSSLALIREIAAPLLTGDEESDTLYLVAVTEVATNAIEAHKRISNHEPITVNLDLEGKRLTVIDRGGGLDGQQGALLADSDDLRGRGLFIARRICPALMIAPDESGTAVTLPYQMQG